MVLDIVSIKMGAAQTRHGGLQPKSRRDHAGCMRTHNLNHDVLKRDTSTQNNILKNDVHERDTSNENYILNYDVHAKDTSNETRIPNHDERGTARDEQTGETARGHKLEG